VCCAFVGTSSSGPYGDIDLDRLNEFVGVYGPTIKGLIHEKFGDGIMSSIDFDMEITRVENPKGDPVKIEMSGKYLSFNSW
ncbi:MAG: hypothetical protein AAF405_08145, partial [Pseudomonadota bacterium]